ncbi:hypothetical protein BC829DRAFT_423240 [Chytridium lagenaria]|nr:hypothetical protein BC829DRAFT_423240 [Chytridium lagenaria]
MSHDIIYSTNEHRSQYLDCWEVNPECAPFFAKLNYSAISKVIQHGAPPPEYATLWQVDRHLDDAELRARKDFASNNVGAELQDPYYMLQNVFEFDGLAWERRSSSSSAVSGTSRGNMRTPMLMVFIYGLPLEDVRRKVIEIYKAIATAVNGNMDFDADDFELCEPFPSWVNILAVKFKSFFGYIDPQPSCCVGYNGMNVFALPRALRALTRRYNLVDMTRRSASYEFRLFKYVQRGFAVADPMAEASRVYRGRVIETAKGLAKLLTWEAKNRDSWIVDGDLTLKSLGRTVQKQSELSDYQVVKIPYGKFWRLYDIVELLIRIHEKIQQQGQEQYWKNRGFEYSFHIHHNNIFKCLDAKLSPLYCEGDPDPPPPIGFEESWLTQNPGMQLFIGNFEPVNSTWEEWLEDAYACVIVEACKNGEIHSPRCISIG